MKKLSNYENHNSVLKWESIKIIDDKQCSNLKEYKLIHPSWNPFVMQKKKRYKTAK